MPRPRAVVVGSLLLLCVALGVGCANAGVDEWSTIADAWAKGEEVELSKDQHEWLMRQVLQVEDSDLPVCAELEEDEAQDSFRALLLVTLVIICLLLAFVLRQLHSKYFHETAAYVILGAVSGAILFLADVDRLRDVVSFNSELFFLLLLPPIIFESGYNMNKRVFFAHFAYIVTIAIVGSLVSCFIVGCGLWLVASFSVLRYQLTLVECLCFGALISATDPVTVLAIFKELQVDQDLYAKVFGESALNDAVAIVLYSSLLGFIDNEVDTYSIVYAILQFFVISVGSICVGCTVGLLNALLYKYTNMYNYPTLEFALFVLYSFSSYLLAEGLQLSGIVAILFCGITMAHYTRKNLSVEAKHLSIHFWEVLASLAETYVFLYLGLSIFSVWGDYDLVMICVAIPLCLIGRALHVFPISLVFNLMTKARRKRRGEVGRQLAVPISHQLMSWFSGLRGAIAFALAMDLEQRLGNAHGTVILTTTIVIVGLSVLVLGSLTTKTLELLKIETGYTIREEDSPYKISWWRSFDKQYIKPFFTRPHNPVADVPQMHDVDEDDFEDVAVSIQAGEDGVELENVANAQAEPEEDLTQETNEQ